MVYDSIRNTSELHLNVFLMVSDALTLGFLLPHCHRSESYWAVKCEKLQSGICMQGDSLSCQTWLLWDRQNSLDEAMCCLCPVMAVCGPVRGVT